MHILIAPNAFKNSLAADAAAEAIMQGLQDSGLAAEYTLFPVGDGGDGTGTLLTRQLGGEIITAAATDPLGRPINACFGWVAAENTAVIEMAEASGLRLLKTTELDPLHASSSGTGLLIKQALDKGAKNIVLTVGGSATVDGGCGLLQALGFRFLDAWGKELKNLPAELAQLAAIDTAADRKLQEAVITVLCDVRNPLLGEAGAAAVFGPQKGATPEQVRLLEAGLQQFARVVDQEKNIDVTAIMHGGAAGGVAAGLFGLLDAVLVNGIDRFLDLADFDSSLAKADLVITGEGSLDRQTLEGKAPFGVALRSAKHSVPVIAMAGRIDAGDAMLLEKYFDRVICINSKETDMATALASTRSNLAVAASMLGNELAQKSRPL